MVTASEPSNLFPKDLKEYDTLMERTKRGDETTLPVLREMLTEPLIVEIWGNMAAYAERSLIRKLSGNDLAIREGLHRKMESLRAELAGPTPSPLERLLVERIVVCWLHLYRLETIYVDKESESLHLGAYYQRSVSAAHRRFLSAIKTLVVVRKLALPELRVNIASKQGKGAGAAQLHEEKRGRPGRRSRRRGGRIGARYPAAGAARRSG